MDFTKNCIVNFLFLTDENEGFVDQYERPLSIDDQTLKKEAQAKAKDRLLKKTNGEKELISVYIARSQKQLDGFLKEVKSW